jgi:hypothetical protein
MYLWAVTAVGFLLIGGGAYREYFAESEEEEGEGSILTNSLFIGGAAILVCMGLYGLWRMLAG